MDGWRVGRLVILVGSIGVVAGAALYEAADDSRRGLLGRGSVGGLALSLLLAGLATWHFRAWGLGKLVGVGLLAAGCVQFTLVDFGDGSLLWEQDFTRVELAARWVMVVSAAVVLVGVLWSFFELIRSTGQRSQDVAASVEWWRRWGLVVVGGFVALWVVGQVLGQLRSEEESAIETADDDDDPVVLDDEWTDEWSITPFGDETGGYLISMIKTVGPLAEPDEEPDEDGVGGRLVWSETEIELCDVQIFGAGDGFVQIGLVTPTTEGCPGMLPAFVDFGLPDNACLFVRVDGILEEHCAPLAVR